MAGLKQSPGWDTALRVQVSPRAAEPGEPPPHNGLGELALCSRPNRAALLQT